MEENNKKQWFEKLRLNSWEVEILIVGFVLVILFNIPDTISLELSKITKNYSVREVGDFLFWSINLLTLGILNSIVHILILSFSLYLGLRGFWVGVLGLSSVYPKGINLEKLNFNTIFKKQIGEYNFNAFVIKIDNICSSIFSFCFLISFSIISFCLFLVQMILGSTYLDKLLSYLLNNNDVESYVDIFALPFLICGLLFFLDYFLFGILKKIKWKPFGYVFNVIDKLYKYITLVFIYDTLYYAFISNVKRRLIFFLFISFIFISISLDSVKLEKHIYFPSIHTSEVIMQSRNYEDKFLERDDYNEKLYPKYPFIQSDVIGDNYLKLHIPYHSYMNMPMEEFCPELLSDTLENNHIDEQKNIINCINGAYTIFVDKKEIESNFILYDYAHLLLDIKTFFMVVPLDEFSNGRHVLKINKALKDKMSGATFESGKFEQRYKMGGDSIMYIPFYIYR